jgi:hypothetical protein
VPKMHPEDWDSLDTFNHEPIRGRERAYQPTRKPQSKPDGSESFKCGHCRAFIGPTVSGGKHRNHCPLCLWSRHVDRSFPGDRLSECRSLQEPIGTFYRENGEQMIVHRCAGCGSERHNRIAADDSPVTLLKLEPVTPRRGKYAKPEEESAEQTAS